MKVLIVYSSLTGNTEKICRAAAEVLERAQIYPVSQAPGAEGCDLVVVGYWVDKGAPDAKAAAYLDGLANTKVALLGTLGACPNSEHAQSCRRKGEARLEGRGNNILGSFLCQGKVDPKVVEMMRQKAADVHPMTQERQARLAEAAKHPDERDCENARAFLRGIIAQIAG